jgi:hypothetical protein
MPIGGTAFFGQNQHPRITTNYLNQLSRVGDPGAGVPVSTAQMSGSIVQEYLGFAGGKLTITNPWAPQFADPLVGPLYGGIYMYVRLDPLSPPLTRGGIAIWADELNYIVTATGSTQAKIAGIALNPTFPGYWDFIQIAGVAMVMMTSAGSIGNTATVDASTTPPSITMGSSVLPNSIGKLVLTAAVPGQMSPIELNIIAGYNF